jgi:DNA-binding transcriptional LysR family regulator
MRNVTLKQLRVFAAVVRSGSSAGAAQFLNVSPSAVTLQMQSLQAQVGMPLTERSVAGTYPTEAGRHLLDTVERIEAMLADCDAVLAGLAGVQRGTVRVGVVSTAKYFAPQALAAMLRVHPGLDIQLVVGNRSDIVTGLRLYEVEIAIMGRPPAELDVVATAIGDHPHVVVAPADHALAGRRDIPAAALAGEVFLVREPESGTRMLMERFFAESGIAPRIGMQIGSNETIKQAVIAGLGISFLSAHTIGAELVAQRLVVLDVMGLPIVRRWHVVHMQERRLMPAANAVRQFLSEQGRFYLPAGASVGNLLFSGPEM